MCRRAVARALNAPVATIARESRQRGARHELQSRERYWKDRRRHPRKRVVWPATLETVRGKLACRVSNISPGGARLRVDEPVLVGEYVTLAMPAHGEFDGVVAWQRDSVIGMQF